MSSMINNVYLQTYYKQLLLYNIIINNPYIINNL